MEGTRYCFLFEKLGMALASLLPCQPHDVCVSKLEVQKLTTFFKNIVFEKLESQFTIIKYADIVN